MLAKVLVSMFPKVMGNIISQEQLTFLNGRQLVDGLVAVNKDLDLAKLSKQEYFFEVAFKKAYNSVSWSFLDDMIGIFGFDDRWRNTTKACSFSSSLSVLVNGCPTEDISIQKGLKQGDPLAPFLFIIVMWGLSASLRR